MNDYRRVHRATPLLQFWSVFFALGVVLLANGNQLAGALFRFIVTDSGKSILIALLILFAALLVICGLIWVLSGIWWRHMGYRVGEEELSLRHGVLSKHLRTARYDRTQAVDVIEPFLPRLFGLAAVRVETAGGSDSAIQVGYLPKKEAEELRDAVLHRIRRVQPDTENEGAGRDGGAGQDSDGTEEQGADNPAAGSQEALIPEIPIQRSVASVALNPAAIALIVGCLFALFLPFTWTFLLPILLASVPVVFTFLNSAWRFTARLATDPSTGEDRVELSYGLFERRRQSIRVDRMHAIQVTQPLLWRKPDWYEVRVNVAGYGAAAGKASGTTRVLPVGSREEASALVQLVTGLNAEEAHKHIDATGARQPNFRTPERAWWLTPIDRKQQAVTLVEGAGERPEIAVIHTGRFNRRVCAVAVPHIQELTYSVGPLALLADVRTVRLNLVTGPVAMKARELEPADAAELLRHLRHRPLPAVKGPEP